MKSFIVRVYPAPRHEGADGRLAGIVEDPETGRQQTFHDAQQLWSAIGLMGAGDAERGNDPSRPNGPAG